MITSNIRGIMEEKGISVRKLAALSGLAIGTIDRARGNLILQCSLDTLQTIARACGCYVKDLFTEEEDQDSNNGNY